MPLLLYDGVAFDVLVPEELITLLVVLVNGRLKVSSLVVDQLALLAEVRSRALLDHLYKVDLRVKVDSDASLHIIVLLLLYLSIILLNGLKHPHLPFSQLRVNPSF